MRCGQHRRATEQYPSSNGSPGDLTAVTTADGRFTAMMPHPERVFRNIQMSWMDHAARRWAGRLQPWMRPVAQCASPGGLIYSKNGLWRFVVKRLSYLFNSVWGR